jgi:hypothetical protein
MSMELRLTRCDVGDQLPQKQSLALVSILQSLAAAEISNTRHLRDFRSPAIFEFFNTIRQTRTWQPLVGNTRITLYGVNALRQSPGLEWRRGLRLYPARCTSVEVPMTQRCLADHPASEGLGAIRALRALHRRVLGSEESKR